MGCWRFWRWRLCLIFCPCCGTGAPSAVWWGEERLLFTTRYASVRQKYGAWAFLLGVMVYEFIVVFNNSMARENWPWLQTRVSPCWTGSCISASALRSFAGHKIQWP